MTSPPAQIPPAKVSVAKLDDIPRLAELLGVLFAQESEFEPDLMRQSEGLRRIISQPEVGKILVVRDGASILGMVNLLFTVSTARGGRVAILEDVVVQPEARGRGLGSTLIRGAISVAQSEGCSRITLLTDRVNESAHRFYERHGFERSERIPFCLYLSK